MPMIDIDWLKEHVEVPADLTYEQLAKDLVRVGLEEEEIHASQVTGPIVVGYVVDCTPEPQKNGKTINWCHVDVGDEYNETDENGDKVPRGIVCGAPNMAAGEKVVVTLPGAVLPGDFKIEPRKTYGHISNGMCASERELGLGNDHNGIILLNHYDLSKEEAEALKPGDDAMHLLHLDQPVLEINITPDRGYTLSYRGVAREYHHSTGAAYTDPVVALNAKAPKPVVEGDNGGDVAVEIDDGNPIHGVPGCDRYYARIVRGFNPDAPTPGWMRRRLIRAGMRSISLAVDITNYVMLDLGQPMHAYDLDKIEGPIVVRRANAGEHLTTLDGKDHELSPEDLLITDSPNGVRASRILGLAGVMGGLYGEVTAETRNVFVEAAHFDQVTIARSARRHKTPSEASKRFERGVDDQLQPAAAQMAADLLASCGGGTPSDTPVDVDRTQARTRIDFRLTETKRLTGLDTSDERIRQILEDIGCAVSEGAEPGRILVLPPSWRPDLNDPCDLVEEVARLVGYDEIPVTMPPAPVESSIGLTPNQLRQRQVADELAEYGLVETLSYPFVGSADFKAFGYDEDDIEPVSVEVANPLAGDRPYLRRTILPTLAQTVQRNIRRGIEDVSLYELGHVYLWDPNAPAIPALPGGVKPTDDQLEALDAGLPEQPLHVAAILTGKAVETGWLGERRAVDWTDAVEAMRRVADRLGAKVQLDQPRSRDVPAQWHPGRAAKVMVGDVFVGMVGELHPHVNEALGFPEHSAAFELDLTALFSTLNGKPVQAKPISTFPPVKQDLAFSVPKTISAEQLKQAIVEAAGDDLESIELFDVYTGDQMESDEKSLAYAVVFRSPDRTLQAADTEALRAAIVEKAAPLGAQLRA
ncbi:phenylalanyl-tRNA synthetase beta subunit [Bifidobacterium bohemicum]|uniref:Phenylalanine--tRNA ligase beta subunit n=1 Tax=Bifidobacterium bohemicum DSM 22767 TaxID=1437606 RepID=A0A086ZJH6_9BIFI|nr:phenylalanine--tRNA ligase subunit beta [Bifidobacterium bohemicum]KFI46676.1 phenylalanyl-tRNA synthetase, beta subunit [Bifidobacterium bohemicum DSM 22767]SCB78505.1 phenylalanyl-tRNA synthetase beta subunit [Bifidobacterium bohemicum]